MGSYTYLIITLLVLSGPLALSFDRRVAFYRQYKRLALSIPPVSAVYLLWDVIVTEHGHWSFNPSYAGSWRLFGLPLAEWMFFLVVPYACLFIYEVVKAYFPKHQSKNPGYGKRCSALVLLFLSVITIIYHEQAYTMLALLSSALWLLATLIFFPKLLEDIHVLWYFLLSIVAFLLVNGVLTGLPIVEYNPEAIWNIRIVTIPLEDLFYNISMLGFYLISYEAIGNLLHTR